MNSESIEKIGHDLRGKFDTYVNDRTLADQQNLKNLRQYKGKYDPEIEQNIPKNRSRVYPKDTHTKVNGFTAKLMEMMFPASDKNWEIVPTPIPNISENDLNMILAELQQEKMQQAQVAMQQAMQQAQDQGQDPSVVQPVPPQQVTEREVELRVQRLADEKAKKMERQCEDQLSDIGGVQVDFAQISKKAIRSAGIYGIGVVKGPQVRYQRERTYVQDPMTGFMQAVDAEVPRPYYENVRVWDIFPDMSAKSWYEQEGIFERVIMNRHGLRNLANRPDFKGDVIRKYLREHTTGNFKALNYENDLNTLRQTSNIAQRDARRYEVIRYYGYLSGHELKAAGVEIAENKLDMDLMADVWLLDSEVIKADIAPFGKSPSDMYHAFIIEEDEDSPLTGSGLPEILRDAQMRMCAIDRATMDNMAAAAGPIIEVNDDLLALGQDVNGIHVHKTIHREGQGATANYPAIRNISVDSHIGEMINLRKTVVEIMDVESGLPQWLFGNTQPLGEAFRTSNNMSMMQGGANMMTKDIVRAFDRFTVSLIGSLVAWNMEFNPNPAIKGDYQVMARGTTSLVSKEVRGAALDQFWSTLQPDERVMFDTYDMLKERMKARDLPLDKLKTREEAEQAVAQFQQAQAAAQAVQDNLVQAQTQKQMASAQKDAAQAQTLLGESQAKVNQMLASATSAKNKEQLEYIKLLLQQMEGTGGQTETRA